MPDAVKAAPGAPETLTAAIARTPALKWWRRASQSVGLAIIGQWSFYGIFRCPFIVPYVSCRNCPVITCHGRLLTVFWGFWLLLPLSALLFGRAFCGWACPGGLVHRLMGKAAPLKLRIRNAIARFAPYGKYLGLALAVYVWLAWGQPREAVPIRAGDFFGSVALTFEHARLLWLVRTCIVLALLAAGLLVTHAWCRFACPLGGVLEAVTSFSLFKVYKTEACNDCNKCMAVCGMRTRPAESNCTNCCDCRDACPQDAIKVGRLRQ